MKLRLLLLELMWISAFSSASAQTWTATSAPSNNWTCITSSADGTKLAATAFGVGIYISSDSGMTWSNTSASAQSWTCIASSTNGNKLVAAAVYDSIYTSTNAGADWEPQTPPYPYHHWASVASSADGSKLVAADGYYDPLGQIYVSTNSGVDWTPTSAPSANWNSVASSLDGSTLVAAAGGNCGCGDGAIYLSTDAGNTWTQTSAPTNLQWRSTALSTDGIHIAAAALGQGIYVSPDLGATWVQSLPEVDGESVAWCGNGSELVTATYEEGLYSSSNAGASWTETLATTNFWYSISSSADGSKLAAAGPGVVYTYLTVPTLSICLSTNGIELSWPSNSAAVNFALQQNTNLGSTNWVSVTNSPLVLDTQYRVNLQPPAGPAFYRLASP